MTNNFLGGARIRSVFEDKFTIRGGSLDLDVAELKQGANDAINVGSNVFYVFEIEQCRDVATEKSFLVDVDDAPVGYNPHIVVVIGPTRKEHLPQYQGPERSEEESEAVGDIRAARRDKDGKNRYGKERQEEEEEDAYNILKEHEPVMPHHD